MSSSLQALDLTFLARQTFGDRVLERELLELFEQQCRRLPSRMASGALRERLDAAHTLKGAALAVGAARVASLADALERALDEDLAHETLDRLLLKLDRAIADVQGVIASRSSAAA